MDLVGGILSIENRLGKRKPGQGKDKPAQKHAHTEAPEDKTNRDDERHVVPEYDAYIGRIVDTSA